MAARTWTSEQRAKQAQAIHNWQPWKYSTGARTPEGKAASSQNVIIGQRKRRHELEQARQELQAILAKIQRLARCVRT